MYTLLSALIKATTPELQIILKAGCGNTIQASIKQVILIQEDQLY